MKQIKMVDADHVKKQAQLIRDIAQKVIDACDNETIIDAYARNKIGGGSLAQDSAVLAILLMQYEHENQ